MSTLRTLRGIAEQLERTTTLAREASAAVAEASRSMQASAAGAGTATDSELGRVSAGFAAAVASSSASAERIRTAGASAAAAASETRARVVEEVERADAEAADKLDDLRARLEEQSSVWTEEVKQALEGVEAGAIRITDVLRLWGDARVGVGEDAESIREALDGLDLGRRTEELQQLLADYRRGSADVSQLADAVANSNFLLAQRLSDTLEAFRRGEVTAERIAQIVAEIERLFPGTEFASLAEALEAAARRGEL